VVAHVVWVGCGGLVAHNASLACAALGTRASGWHLACCVKTDGPVFTFARTSIHRAGTGACPYIGDRASSMDAMAMSCCCVCLSGMRRLAVGATPRGRPHCLGWVWRPGRPQRLVGLCCPGYASLRLAFGVLRENGWARVYLRAHVNTPGRHGGLPLHRLSCVVHGLDGNVVLLRMPFGHASFRCRGDTKPAPTSPGLHMTGTRRCTVVIFRRSCYISVQDRDQAITRICVDGAS
jgi:hypothetical protein